MRRIEFYLLLFALPRRQAGPLIEQESLKVGYSHSRTCEVGCATHIDIPYMSIMYLVDEVTAAAP
jgi:hypothetical protein